MKKSAISLINKRIDTESEGNEDFDNELFISNEQEFQEIENHYKPFVKSEIIQNNFSLNNNKQT